MKKIIVPVLGVLVIEVLAVFTWQLLGSDPATKNASDTAAVAPEDDPIDVTMELYGPWLAGLQATSTEFNKTELLNSAPITPDVRDKLLGLLTESERTIDPIICQAAVPERIGAKMVYENETESQVMIVARGKKVPEQALVTLLVQDGAWVISDIVCSQGEVAPELEYTFEQAGNLLKQSLQPPFDNQQWHLVYTKDKVAGNIVPLLFDAGSTCVTAAGVEQVCVPEQLTEALAAGVQGAMQEAGVLVQRLQLP